MTLDSDNWELLQDLFHLAEITPEPERERVLCERCSDGVLRQRALTIYNAWTLHAAKRGPTGISLFLQSVPTDFQG